MKILVTGATGFMGKNLVPQLQKEHDVHLLVRPSTQYRFLGVENVFVFDDNIDELAEYLKRHQVDGVVHLASLVVAEHKSHQVKDLVLSNIYLGTALLDACKTAGVKWFLNTGSIWQNYCAPDKSDQYNPVDLYAATKQAFMDMAKFYTETSPLRFCTLKLCDTYGEGDTRRKVIGLFAEIASSGQTLDMTAGEQKIDLLHIDDVVSGFIALIRLLSDETSKLLPEYVLSSGRQITLRQLADEYAKAHQVTLHINWGGRPYRLREVMTPYKGTVVPGWKAKHCFL